MSSRAMLERLVEIISCRPVLTRKDLARRYGRDAKTIDRWHSSGVLPRAVYLKGSLIPMWRPLDIHNAEDRNPKLRKLTRAD